MLQLNQLDKTLRTYKNLNVLVMSGNYLTEIPTKCLPSSVKFLELYCNSMKSIRSLCENPKLKFYHLGLGRNQLTNSKY